MAAPSQGVLDSFNRANGALGSNWTTGLYTTSVAAEVVSNAFGGPSGAGFFDAYWDVATFGATDGEVFGTVGTKSGNGEIMYLVLGATAPGTAGYDAYMLTLTPAAGTDTIEVFRTINEADTSLGTRSQEVGVGDSLALVRLGNGATVTLQIWYRASGGSWAQLGADITDSTGSRLTAAGYIGCGVQELTGRWDDFGGGDQVASVVVTPSPSTARASTWGPYATGGEPPEPDSWGDDPILTRLISAKDLYLEDTVVAVLAAHTFFGAPPSGVSIAPAESASVAATVNPTVVLGSVSVTPATSAAVAATADPTVSAGGNISVEPAVSAAAVATADPTVVRGSVSVSPATSSAVAATVNPTVVAGAVTVAPSASTAAAATPAPTTTVNAMVGLRFYGTDTATYNDVDRVRIPLRNAGSPTAADVGAGDFTYEVWLRCAYADNTSTRTDDWRYSNIILDRDAWNSPRGHGLGVARSGSNLVAVFGVAGASLTHVSIAGTSNIGDGAWHHVKVDRNASTGLIRLLIDGAQEASGTYTTGTLAYDGTNAGGQDNDYIVIGTEKHDVGVGFNGTIDAVRISSARRLEAPERPLLDDADTAVLYWFNEASGTTTADASGNGITATIARGGPNAAPVWTVETAGVGTQISPDASASAAATVNPTVTIGGLQVAPSASVMVAATVAPTVVLGSVTAAPAASAAVVATADPAVVRGAVSVAPSASAAAATTADPTVTLGAVSVSPSASAAVATTANPTVSAGGDVVVSPSASAAAITTADPVVVLGPVTIAPAAASARASSADPDVVLGPISITPTSAAARAASADPTVTLGALVIGPAVASITTATIDPTVTGGISASGIVRATLTARRPSVTFTSRKPAPTFTSRAPSVTFTAED